MKRWNIAAAKSPRVLGVLLSVTLSMSMFGNFTATVQAAERSFPERSFVERSSVERSFVERSSIETLRTTETGKTAKKHSSESGKAETVYVMADADGATREIIVSEWLRNQRGSSVLEDFSNLTDIENVEGYEEFTKNSDGSMTWQADGSDIYYQGRTDAKLPVGVSLSYKLDGKEIAADELAGKSGRVTIRFDYTNNLTAETMVNGKEETIAVPFAMISGAVLDGDRFSNIEVTNGKVVSEGSNNIVVGMAFPGLKESLNLSVIKKNFDDEEDKKKLDDLEEDIPDYVEITADVTDFKLDMTLTIASSDLLNVLNLDDIDTSELKDSMNDLDEATQELIDGVDELKDGTGQLADGAGELSDGAGQLSDGAGQLSDGADKLAVNHPLSLAEAAQGRQFSGQGRRGSAGSSCC